MLSFRIIFIYYLSFCIAFITCDEKLNDGKIKTLVGNKLPLIQKFQEELESLDVTDDSIMAELLSKGYETFMKSAHVAVYNGVDKKDHFKTAQDMMKFCQIYDFTPYLLENAMDESLYATTFYGIFTNPQTKKSKFIVAIGQKEEIVSKTSDWLLIDFKEEFDFYLGYSISFGHYGPYLDNYNGETHINALAPNNFSSYQSKNVYKFLFTLTFNYLNQLLSL